MPRSGSNEFTRVHDALVIMFDAYSQKVQALLVKFAQDINTPPSDSVTLPIDTLMRYLIELDDFTDDTISESLTQLQLVQKQTSGSLYERTQLAVLDTKLRRLQDEHAMRCREFKGAIGKMRLPGSVLFDSA
jgi:hypothetical protein